MFIRHDNTLKWKWIGYGALIVLVLVVAGLLGGDKLMHFLIRDGACMGLTGDSADAGILCSIAKIIGALFAAKMWIAFTVLSVIIFFIYKAFTNEFDFRYAFIKIKNSYVFYIFCSVMMACFTTGILKVLIGRSRPFMYEALGKTFFVPGSFEDMFNSMPSGHTAVSFAGLVMIGMLFPRIKWATWTMAIIIGVSRIYVGAHWASDVVLGAFIGMLCADFTKAILKKINSK